MESNIIEDSRINSYSSKSRLILLSGPSGSGKTTIINSLINKYDIYPLRYYTTREQRNDDSTDLLHFITLEQYIEMFNNGDFILSFGTHKNRYGVLYDEFVNNVMNDKDMILAISYKNFFDILNKKMDKMLDVHLIILNFNDLERMVKERLIDRDPNISNDYLEMKIKYAIKEYQEYFSLIKNYANCIINTDEESIEYTEEKIYNTIYNNEHQVLRRLK